MGFLFYYQLLLILKNAYKLAKNAINKSLIIFKVFSEKIFKFSSCHSVFAFKATFMLMLALNYYCAEKQGREKDLIRVVSSSGFKKIFILLVEIVAI